MNRNQARENMIEQQIRPWDVLDQRVLNALADLIYRGKTSLPKPIAISPTQIFSYRSDMSKKC